MTLAGALSAYTNLNLLIVIGFVGLSSLTFVLKKLKLQLEASRELNLHYVILLTILSLTVIQPMLPRSSFFSPTLKVWSAESIKAFSGEYSRAGRGGVIGLSEVAGDSTIGANQVSTTWMILGFTILLFGTLFIFRDLHQLLKIKRESFLVRQIGNVRIFVNDSIHVPFSYWLPRQANVVLPSSFMSRHEDYPIAVAHELQHHRQLDTQWVYIVWALKLICIINPAIYFWNRWISELQEFACDETLVDRKKVESQAYARCLVEVAQTAIDQKRVPVCATGLTFLVERNLLHRRIERMFSESSNKVGRPLTVAVGLLIASVMGVSAYASNGLVQDRRVTLSQAKAMATRSQSETGFPVVVNDRVLKQLNRYIGTPDGRAFMRESLARMESYKGVVGDNLKKYGVPDELMAVPIIESGYQNLAENAGSQMKSAGIWQFIASTARNYGLRVDTQKDERLDAGLLTDAAMRYLQSNNLRFKDWQLSVLSFNMGEDAVQKGMTALGSRDAWTLIRNGYEGDKDYLPRLMAAVLIMRNPESVQ